MDDDDRTTRPVDAPELKRPAELRKDLEPDDEDTERVTGGLGNPIKHT